MQDYAKWSLSTLFLAILFMVSCKHDPFGNGSVDPVDTSGGGNNNPQTGVPCDPDSIYFENQILPMLVSNCSQPGCHNEIDHEDGVVLTSFDNLKNTVEKYNNTNWNENKLLRVIQDNDPEDRMPPVPNTPLSTDQINLLKAWISQGAQNNACNDNYNGCDTLSGTYSAFIQPLMQQKCVGCHSGANPQGNLSITNYNETKSIALDGSLVAALTRTSAWMPLGASKLDDCTLAKIQHWVDQGAPEN
jgi:hypothetical protein